MSNEYIKMWEELNLDIPAHENLMNVLGGFYKDIYLSQENRPEGTGYLDFVITQVHGLRIQELLDAKKEGRKVIGTFCVFVPEDLILAVDGVSVGLCAGAQIGFEEAEAVLPRNTCSLIKSFMGFKLARLCPYFESCDLVVGETTCDGKKKAYEILDEFAPVYVMELPNMKQAEGRNLWKKEILRFKEKLEEVAGKKITKDTLAKGIKIVNDKRKALQRLNRLRAAIPTPISGRDVLLANQISFYDDPIRFTRQINTLCDELEERIKKGEGIVEKGTKRLMLSGCPLAIPNWKLPLIIETSGAVIVGEESCVGTRNTRDLVSEDGQSIDEMIDNISDRYMKIDCACFTPNTERIENIVSMAKDLHVDGVVHYAISFCHPYTIEARKVEKALEKEDIPFLKIETDYSMEDFGILKNRIDAFLDIIK